ncbi:MAG: LysR family transcriptional regulator [Hyphomicrobiales bacterium]
MDTLNYRHLRYFREVAHEGNLTRTATKLNLSQSALSTQIKTLEDRIGHTLFDRVNRELAITEVGQIVLDYADRIFGTGEELVAQLEGRRNADWPLRVGAISTLSRNFQLRFLKPVLEQQTTEIILTSGGEEALLASLKSLALDVMLTTRPPHNANTSEFTAHLIAEQSVGAHGNPARLKHGTLEELLRNEPLIVPAQSSIRTGFDSLIARLGVHPKISAEVDDMAMMRLLAREDFGIAIAPNVVLADEIAAGLVETAQFDLAIVETFYAVVTPRAFPHPALKDLL